VKLLLDTHLLLWAAGQPENLSTAALALIESPENQLLFSAASLWEIAMKVGLGREDFAIASTVIDTSPKNGLALN
jgi:PIN domain nuclease of toxin-antitoxin system